MVGDLYLKGFFFFLRVSQATSDFVVWYLLHATINKLPIRPAWSKKEENPQVKAMCDIMWVCVTHEHCNNQKKNLRKSS